jgi:hypothetical protein
MREMRNADKILVKKQEEKGSIVIPSHRLEDNIKMHLGEKGCGGVN